MNRAGIYYGLTKIAWAFVLLYIDISLGTLNLLPDWAGYLLIWQAISLLSGERRALELLRPFCLGLGLWSAADWLLTLFSRSLSAGFLPLSVVVRVVFSCSPIWPPWRNNTRARAGPWIGNCAFAGA